MKTDNIKAVIFDLDGVIVSTDDCHYLAWQKIADKSSIFFNREINERLRGVSRMESLEIILEKTEKKYSDDEKTAMADTKNSYYLEYISKITPDDILPGVMDVLTELKKKEIKIAVGSSSRNNPVILRQIGLDNYFDAIADGNDITNSKPDPEVFLLAAEKLNIPPEYCLVIEDADAGVEAAKNAKMIVLAVGSAQDNPDADFSANDLSVTNILQKISKNVKN